MQKRIVYFAVLVSLLTLTCSPKTRHVGDPDRYRAFSRFTDPKQHADMLVGLPDDVTGICRVAKEQTVHHNLLPHFGVARTEWKNMARLWPPKMTDLLGTLQEMEPHSLFEERSIENRIIGACMLESHLLAGMLRYQGIAVRIRAGYFKDVRKNEAIVLDFWENVSRAKGIEQELLDESPDKWREIMRGLTKQQIDVNHHIEHWICEYWDEREKRWRLLDANDTFLQASSGLDVGFHLPREHFEYAFEAWKKMRNEPDFNPDQYKEWPQDGRSHIRSQLLMDFFNLLNHDVAGEDQPTRDEWKFVKEKKYEDLSPQELDELDRLADLLAQDPSPDQLVAYYRRCETLRVDSAEKDPYSFLSRN